MKKFGKIIITALLFTFAVVLTVFSERATQYASDALGICFLSVLPTLFPFMVISHMLVSSNSASYVGKIVPVSRMYGLPDCSSTAILLGALCGFPVGAKAAADMYKKGKISKTEAEVLLCSSANTGPSFVVFVIGGVFFGSKLFGWQLFIFQLASSFVASFTVNRILFPFKKEKKTVEKPYFTMPNVFSAVADSVSSAMTVCGFIVFFSVISGFAVPLISDISPVLGKVVCSILEFTQGSRTASLIGGAEGRFLCGLSVGFSGICVLCQTAAFTSPLKLSLNRCICSKILQGILTGILAAVMTTPDITGADAFYDTASAFVTSPFLPAASSAVLYAFLIKKLFIKQKI